MKKDLFENNLGINAAKETKRSVVSTDKSAPLSVRMRPVKLEEFAGQDHILGEGRLLRRTILADRLSSVIFYGPPGSGKTTLAHIISNITRANFKTVNAVTSGVADLRKVMDEARMFKNLHDRRTILFIDEIHRFNKAQQDVLMPEVEDGTVILIGATTHNPSFSIVGPLLSRSLIFELKPLQMTEIVSLLKRALRDTERGMGSFTVKAEEEALRFLAKVANGDARRALNALEVGVLTTEPDVNGTIRFDISVAQESAQKRIVFYDKDEDYHYDTASAFIKSMRGSDPDAAIYWLAKMIYAGEDPRFIARRIVILASEDIGNADPQALVVAASALQAVEFVGMPEARIILGQAVTYMASAPKSNAAYLAIEEALGDVENDKSEEVPNHLRDKSYFGAKRLGHGKGYKYAHSYSDHYVKQNYVDIKKQYYKPTVMGFEKIIKERLDKIKKSGK